MQWIVPLSLTGLVSDLMLYSKCTVTSTKFIKVNGTTAVTKSPR